MKWISVEERLPESDSWVLCWCSDVEVSVTVGYLTDNNEWVWAEDHTTTLEDLTHWMPLPETP